MLSFFTELLTNTTQEYIFLSIIIFIIIRTLAIVIPPIPGILIDISGIITFGWLKAFIFAEIGILLGATIAFSITRFYRKQIHNKFPSTSKIFAWEKRLSNLEGFWAWVAIRLSTNPAFDYISYAAGLSNITFTRFILSTFLGNIPSVFLIFYLGGIGIKLGGYIFLLLISILILLMIIINRKIKLL